MTVTIEKAETGLAGRYATAVFELARESGAIDAVSADLTTLRTALRESADLAHLVKSPVFSAEEQTRALTPVLVLLNLSPLSTKFILTVAHKRRLFALEAIIAAYERLAARGRGEIAAEVTAARALKDDEMTSLKAVLKARLGREPRLSSRVDPTLLGGLVVKVGSRMIDTSLRAKLEGLSAVMKG
jgi:F-type H+-transporting ATPase subunit delta